MNNIAESFAKFNEAISRTSTAIAAFAAALPRRTRPAFKANKHRYGR